MASSLEEHLSDLLHDNPLGMAAAVAVLAVLLLLVMRLAAPGKPKTFLDPQQFQPLTLSRIDTLTHNTKRFVFKLPDPRMRVGLPTGQHITFLAKDSDGKDVYRPYTPVTDDDTPGAVEFVIKLYEQGKMSQVLSKMGVGDAMLMKGPRGRFSYKRNMKRAFGGRPSRRVPAWSRGDQWVVGAAARWGLRQPLAAARLGSRPQTTSSCALVQTSSKTALRLTNAAPAHAWRRPPSIPHSHAPCAGCLLPYSATRDDCRRHGYYALLPGGCSNPQGPRGHH
jgi:hypothetical protein